MNPELLQKLRALFTSGNMPADATRVAQADNSGSRYGSATSAARGNTVPGTNKKIADLFASPTADSAFRMVGVPGSLGDRTTPGSAGVYVPRADYIGMSGAEAQDYKERPMSDRMTLLHEAAHRMQYKEPERRPMPGSGFPFYGEETEADLFARVFDFLSKTGNPADTANAKERFKNVAQDYFGSSSLDSRRATSQLAKTMLADKSRVFRGHPLRQMFGLYPEQQPVPVSAEEFAGRFKRK